MTKLIPLTKGMSVLVDDCDYEELSKFKWYLHMGRYAARTVRTKTEKRLIFMHRIIAGTKPGQDTDHINRNCLDNRRSNLRPCTHAQNVFNKESKQRAKSGYRGVFWNCEGQKWMAKIQFHHKQIYLGLFADPAEAARVYDIAARKYHGQFAITNFKETGR